MRCRVSTTIHRATNLLLGKGPKIDMLNNEFDSLNVFIKHIAPRGEKTYRLSFLILYENDESSEECESAEYRNKVRHGN